MNRTRKSKRQQMQEKINEFNRLYDERDSLDHSLHKWRPYFKIAEAGPFLTVLALSILAMITISFFRYGKPPAPLTYVVMTILSFIYIVVADKIKDLRRASNCPGKDYGTIHLCNNYNLRRMQKLVDMLDVAVFRMRVAYLMQQQTNEYRDYCMRLQDARAISAEFELLFEVIEKELGGTVTRVLSEDVYRAPQHDTAFLARVKEEIGNSAVETLCKNRVDEEPRDIVMQAKIENLPEERFFDFAVPIGSTFDLNVDEFKKWKAYIAMITSFKENYENLESAMSQIYCNHQKEKHLAEYQQYLREKEGNHE